MKTTLNIDDTVMEQLRKEAARQGRPMSELVEAGLRRILARAPRNAEEYPELPVFRSGGAQVDIADRDRLYDVMEDH